MSCADNGSKTLPILSDAFIDEAFRTKLVDLLTQQRINLELCPVWLHLYTTNQSAQWRWADNSDRCNYYTAIWWSR